MNALLLLTTWTLSEPTILTSCCFFFLYISSSFKEQSAHVTSVKNILENHASYLMSGKELSKLVAFVKGTQFDLVVRRFTSFLIPTSPSGFIVFFWSLVVKLSCLMAINCRSIFNVKDMGVLGSRILHQGLN